MAFPDRFYPAAVLRMSVRTPSESEPGSAAVSFSFQLKDEQVQERNDILFQFQWSLGSQPSLAQSMLAYAILTGVRVFLDNKRSLLIFPLRRPELARVRPDRLLGTRITDRSGKCEGSIGTGSLRCRSKSFCERKVLHMAKVGMGFASQVTAHCADGHRGETNDQSCSLASLKAVKS